MFSSVSLFLTAAPAAAEFTFDRKFTSYDAGFPVDDSRGIGYQRFGTSIVLSGNTALIGAVGDGNIPHGGDSSVYVYDIETDSFTQTLVGASNDGDSLITYVSSTALSGNTALIGSPFTWNQQIPFSGSAYLLDITTGSLLQTLTAPDAAAYDFLGGNVVLSGTTALTTVSKANSNGDPASFVYQFDATTGNFLNQLVAPDSTPHDGFGISMEVIGNIALIGASGNDDNGLESGSVYLFDITTGDFLQKLTAPDGAAGDSFGGAMALNENTLIIGASGDDDNGDNSGSVYLFDITTGDFLQKLTAPDGVANDYFGGSLALSGNTALIGAPSNVFTSTASGSAYLFDITTGNFLQKLTAPDGAAYDGFGGSVALTENTAFVGASGDDLGGEYEFDSGSVYVFKREAAKSVPEPITVWGFGAVAVGFGAWQRRHNDQSSV